MGKPVALVIAAGGLGSRLGANRKGGPKSLLELDGQPLVVHAVRHLLFADLHSVTVVAAPEHLEKLLLFVRKVAPVRLYGCIQDAPIGTMDVLRRGLEEIRLREPDQAPSQAVAFLLGDNVPPKGTLARALSMLNDDESVFFSRRVSRVGTSARIVRTESGRAVELQYGRTLDEPGEICPGAYVYGKWIWSEWSALVARLERADGECNIDPFNAHLLATGRARVVPATPGWIHVNTPEDFREAVKVLRMSEEG